MPYITQSNSKNILYHIDINQISPYELDKLYVKRLWLLSKKEQLWLSGAKQLFGTPDEFINSIYIKQKSIDTKNFVYEGGLPAYHEDPRCERLNSTYNNFEIPPEIKEKGDIAIQKFREWFKENQYLYENDERKFLNNLEARFLLKNPPKKISNSNSGIVDFNNIDITKLESEIDQLLAQAERFYYESPIHQNTIDLKGDFAYKLAKTANKDSIIYIWHHSYKEKLKEYLLTYYRVKLNPDLEFSGRLLDALNFHPCQYCCKPKFA